MGLLRDYEPSCGPSFEALGNTHAMEAAAVAGERGP